MSQVDNLIAIFSRNEPAWLTKEKADNLAYEEDEDFEPDDDSIVASTQEKIDTAMRFALHSFQSSKFESAYQSVAYVLNILTKKSPEYGFDATKALEIYSPLNELGDDASAAIINEVWLTISFLKSYGENIQAIYHSARKQERFIDELMTLDEVKNNFFTGEQSATLVDVIKCAGTFLRLRYVVLFMTYEDNFSLDHLKQYAQISEGLATQSESDVNQKYGNGAATLHRLLNIANGGPDELTLSQRFEVAFAIINHMEAHEVFVNVDTSTNSVWETTADIFYWSQDHDIENLQLLGPVMSLRGKGSTLIFLNPTNNPRTGISQEEAEIYLRRNNKHEKDFMFSELSQQDY
jgi:hypothetical protein